MQRLVTQQDLIDNPDLVRRGVSVNQHWDFPSFDQPAPPPKQGIGFDPSPGIKNYKPNPDFKEPVKLPVEETKPTPEDEMALAKAKMITPIGATGKWIDMEELKSPIEEPPVTGSENIEQAAPEEQPIIPTEMPAEETKVELPAPEEKATEKPSPKPASTKKQSTKTKGKK